MPTSGTQRRFCVIHPGGGPISVRLQANNALRAGAGFKLTPLGTPTATERWNMAAGDLGHSDHALTTPPDQLDRASLTWEILTCSLIPGVDTGTVEIQVLQDGVSCPCTKPAQWQLEDVPDCADSTQTRIAGRLDFLAQ